MRILHTSDWHLGRSFHRVGLLDAQSTFIDHLVDTIRAERVDTVVVSGDVYDRAIPPVDAVELANDALRRLVASGARVVITSGNHDSAQRLGFAADLLDLAGVHVRTDPASVGTPLVVPDEHGDVAIYGLPYLEPEVVREPWSLPARSHQATLDEAMRRVRDDLDRRDAATRSVVLAHAFVTGSRPSDSERDISVGGVAQVGLDTFDGVDYVALGHLHGRHTLSASVRYSGSPLAYSFSESRHLKGSWLVELDRRGLGDVTFVPAPVPRRLALLRGTLDDLLRSPDLVDDEDSFVQATLTDDRRPSHAMDRLRTRFPHTLVLGFEPASQQPRDAPAGPGRVIGRTDRDVLTNFFTDVRANPPSEDELDLLQAAADACRHDEDLAS
jgi:exonuclease SbcD